MKKIIVVLILLCSSSMWAQDKGAFKLYILGGGAYRTFKWESWDIMTSSYNLGWQANLKSQAKGLIPQYGYTYGAAFRFMVFSVEVKRYGFGAQTESFVFQNGDQRDLRVKLQGWNYNFPILIPAGKIFSIGMDMQMNIEKGSVESSIRYKDGTVSYGMENPQNGIFNFNKYSTLWIGPRVEIGSKVRVQLNVLWPFGFGGTHDVVGLKDLGSDYGGVWSNGDRTVYYVADYTLRNNYNQYYVGLNSESLLLRQVKGMKVECTVAVDLFKRTLIK